MTVKNKNKNQAGRPAQATLADRYVCYEQAVQCVESEIDFVDTIFKRLRGRYARALREDFCGTTNTSCEWVRRRKTNIALSIDQDRAVLDWGKKNRIARLTKAQQKRIRVIQADVANVKTEPVEIVLAMNFSYWLLKERKRTIKYFKAVYRALARDGIFFLDAYGGYEAFQELKEKTKYKDFTYIWEQYRYNPISGIARNYIHFKFRDGSRMMKAFSYEWRVWTLPEILEMLSEAGFRPVVYWEQAGEDGEGNGVFIPETEGDADAGWIAYLVAEK